MGVAMTFMCTTVSTPGPLDHLGDHRVADVGADELGVADVVGGRDDVDADHLADPPLGADSIRANRPPRYRETPVTSTTSPCARA